MNDLGIIINKCLSWDEHINNVCNKTYSKLRLLWTVTDFASTDLRRKLFLSYVFPWFVYGDLILFGMHEYNMNTLNKAFKAGVRYIYRLRKYDHISFYLKNIVGCTLKEFYQYRTCLALYKLVKSHLPMYLYNKLIFSSLTRNNNFIIPRNNCDAFNSSFFVKGIGCWNNLSLSIKLAPSEASFKRLYFSNLGNST